MGTLQAASQAAVYAQTLLDDPRSSELLMMGHNTWFTRTGGKLTYHNQLGFASEDQLVGWLNSVLESCETTQRIDGSTWKIETSYYSPTVQARLHIVCPPVSEVYQVTVAKQTTTRITLEDMLETNTLSEDMANFLNAAVTGHCTIIVGGGTGSGKTTMVNALASLFGAEESIIVIEEVPELSLPQAGVRTLRSRAVHAANKTIPVDVLLGAFGRWAHDSGSGDLEMAGKMSFKDFTAWLGHNLDSLHSSNYAMQIHLGDLVNEALRMRPERIVVSEVRGAEAYDMLKAVGSGHAGMATVHGDGPDEILERLQSLVMEGPNHPSVHYAATLVAHNVDLVIYMGAPVYGQHRVESILEVHQAVPSDTVITRQVLWKYNANSGQFEQDLPPSHRLQRKLGRGGIIGVM